MDRSRIQPKVVTQMKTAAIYARYSSHKQREESIEEQIAECQAYALKNDISVVEVYSDSAISGKTENRDAWQKMMDSAKHHLFEVLLVYTVDRMGRDRYALTVAKKQLRDCGVEIIAIKQPMIDGPEGIILDALMDGLAEYYNADLARKVNRGMSDNARKGLANGSKPPLGYKVDPISKTYIIDEAQAEIVRFIFNAYVGGDKIGDIVAACEQRAYRNSNGHAIDNNVITRLLKNRKYTGLYKWKDIEIPDGMPRIISDEIFQLAQLRIQSMKHKNARHKAKREYLLADKVFCGSCGEQWVGESGYSSTGKFYSYYKCRGAKSKTCGMKAIPQEKLEAAVYEFVMIGLFPDGPTIERFVDYYLSHHAEQHGYAKEVSRLRTQLKTTDQKIDRIMQGVMQGIGIETAHRYLEPLETEKKQLEFLIEDTTKKADQMDRERLIQILTRWLDVTALSVPTVDVSALSPDQERQAKLYRRHMQAVLRSPVLQKVIIETDDNGTPKPRIKLGIDLSKLLSGEKNISKTTVSSVVSRNMKPRSYSTSDRSPSTSALKRECFFVTPAGKGLSCCKQKIPGGLPGIGWIKPFI